MRRGFPVDLVWTGYLPHWCCDSYQPHSLSASLAIMQYRKLPKGHRLHPAPGGSSMDKPAWKGRSTLREWQLRSCSRIHIVPGVTDTANLRCPSQMALWASPVNGGAQVPPLTVDTRAPPLIYVSLKSVPRMKVGELFDLTVSQWWRLDHTLLLCLEQTTSMKFQSGTCRF